MALGKDVKKYRVLENKGIPPPLRLRSCVSGLVEGSIFEVVGRRDEVEP